MFGSFVVLRCCTSVSKGIFLVALVSTTHCGHGAPPTFYGCSGILPLACECANVFAFEGRGIRLSWDFRGQAFAKQLDGTAIVWLTAGRSKATSVSSWVHVVYTRPFCGSPSILGWLGVDGSRERGLAIGAVRDP